MIDQVNLVQQQKINLSNYPSQRRYHDINYYLCSWTVMCDEYFGFLRVLHLVNLQEGE